MDDPVTLRAMEADVYVRISDDREGLEVGVERQELDCRALAATLGATVRKVWKDNDVGASTLSRKPRPDYDGMVAAVRAGEAKMILAYSNSRLTRRPLELEEWITLHDQTGVQIQTCVSGSDDLSTADGRMVARIKASVDAAEAERTGERVTRAWRHVQQKGLPGSGPRPFGFETDRITHEPEEADAIRWAVAHLLRGGSVGEVAAEWNARGLHTSWGKDWRTQTVTQTLSNPRLKGQRAHWVNVNGKRGHWEPVIDSSGNEVTAVWEPILESERFDQLQELFEERRTKRSLGEVSGRRYLLTPFLRCGACGGRMRAAKSPTTKGGLVYRCDRQAGCGKVARAAYRIDAIVVASVLQALAAILTGVQPAPVSLHLDDEVRRLEGLLGDALKAWKSGDLPSADYFTLRRELTEERKRLQGAAIEEQKKRESATTQVDALSRWETGTLAEKQAILKTMITAVVIDPSPRKTDGTRMIRWNPKLVRIVWKHAK